jgi:hypothetical protein
MYLLSPFSPLTNLPLALQIPLAILGAAALTVAFTRLYTTVRYRIALAYHVSALASSSSSNSNNDPLSPPQIPYTIPFLGSALSFLAPKPGLFWQSLFSFHPPTAGCCTLLLGGRVAHILHNPASVQALFKSRDTSRQEFNVNIMRTSFNIPEEDIRK